VVAKPRIELGKTGILLAMVNSQEFVFNRSEEI